MEIRAAEISDIIKRQIQEYEREVEVRETGRVLSCGDGIARIYGLDKAAAGELLEFPHNIFGLVLNLASPQHEIYRRYKDRPLIIPEGAVVVPGSRPLTEEWARNEHLSISTPIIIKYRDEKTDAATALEDALR